jgi:hypothetical protein
VGVLASRSGRRYSETVTAGRATTVRRFPWWAWSALAILVVVGSVAALGGFRDVPITRVPTISLGDTYRGAEVDARITGSELMDAAPDGSTPRPGHRYLALDVTVTDTTDHPVPATAITLRAVAGSAATGSAVTADQTAALMLLTRDGQTPASLEPGVPTLLSFFWQVPTAALDDGDRFVAGVFQSVPQSNVIFGSSYSDPTAVVRMVLHVGASA